MERIIDAATEPGEIVADFFSGSGTTAVAAERTRRRWIICDSSEVAIDLAESRLAKLEARYQRTTFN